MENGIEVRSIEIRYAGVVVGRSTNVRDWGSAGAFIGFAEPLPSGTTLVLRGDGIEQGARVIEVFESADPAIAGMQVKFVASAEAARPAPKPAAPPAVAAAPAPAAPAPAAPEPARAPTAMTAEPSSDGASSDAASSDAASSDAASSDAASSDAASSAPASAAAGEQGDGETGQGEQAGSGGKRRRRRR